MRCGEHGQTRLKSAVPCIFPMESQKPRATRVVETIPKDGDENCYYYIDNCRQEIEIREKRFISLEGLTKSIFLVDLQMCREFRWTIPEMIHWHYVCNFNTVSYSKHL